MLKKRTAILFLSLAYVILLGHNIIPHHHDDHLTEHHDSEHGDDASNDELNHLFAHFTHADDDFSFTTTPNISNTFSKLQLSFVAVLTDDFSLDEFPFPPILHKPPTEQLIYLTPPGHPSGLRAPPATFI